MATTDAGGEHVERPLVTPEFLENRRTRPNWRRRRAETTARLSADRAGKTTVSLLVTAERLDAVGGKSLMLAPTKPLVQQHAEFYREALELDDEDVVVFTGEVRPDDRAALWDDARIVIATPQVVENDLVGNRISLPT